MTPFAHRLAAWQARHGRNHLPWQSDDPDRVWLSEIMLQQTQVATVLQYYPRFLARFPDVASLAAAADDDVLALWSGLGYYSRARNLHHAARQIMGEHGGQFPRDRAGLETLKGVGRSTAAAIAVFAYATKRPSSMATSNACLPATPVFTARPTNRRRSPPSGVRPRRACRTTPPPCAATPKA